MIQSIGFCQFTDSFRDMGRKDQFSYQGLRALFDYLVEYEESTGTPVELDVIALCCEYCEFDDLAEVQESYTDIESLEDLQDHTTVIECDNGHIIIQSY